jgi:hypothetical protein
MNTIAGSKEVQCRQVSLYYCCFQIHVLNDVSRGATIEAVISRRILFKVCFIQNSVLFRIRFGTFFQYIHIVYQYLIDINSVFIDFTEYYRK